MILPHKSNCTVSQKITSERRISTLSLSHYHNLTENQSLTVCFLRFHTIILHMLLVFVDLSFWALPHNVTLNNLIFCIVMISFDNISSMNDSLVAFCLWNLFCSEADPNLLWSGSAKWGGSSLVWLMEGWWVGWLEVRTERWTLTIYLAVRTLDQWVRRELIALSIVVSRRSATNWLAGDQHQTQSNYLCQLCVLRYDDNGVVVIYHLMRM